MALKIVVIEPAEEIGRGMAYATDDPEHLLNVRVANMTVRVWQISPNICSNGFSGEGWGSGVPCPAPYCFLFLEASTAPMLAGLGRDLINSGEITHVRDRCVDLIENRNSVRIALESGDTINAEIVVLATGNETKSIILVFPCDTAVDKRRSSGNSQRSTGTDHWDWAHYGRHGAFA